MECYIYSSLSHNYIAHSKLSITLLHPASTYGHTHLPSPRQPHFNTINVQTINIFHRHNSFCKGQVPENPELYYTLEYNSFYLIMDVPNISSFSFSCCSLTLSGRYCRPHTHNNYYITGRRRGERNGLR